VLNWLMAFFTSSIGKEDTSFLRWVVRLRSQGRLRPLLKVEEVGKVFSLRFD